MTESFHERTASRAANLRTKAHAVTTSGTMTAIIIHGALRSLGINAPLFFGGRLGWSIVQVHTDTAMKQLHKTSPVPRSFGDPIQP